MDAFHFDRLARTLGAGSSRRAVVGALLAALGTTTAFPDLAAAGNRKKKRKNKKTRKKPVQFNAFGCVNVGGACRGNDELCCSGICDGNKPKKGKRDKSTCLAHDESTCQAGQQITECGGSTDVACVSSAGESGFCVTTTGNGAYCLANGTCFPCRTDPDCEPVCGAGAACIPCADDCAPEGDTACVGIEACAFP